MLSQLEMDFVAWLAELSADVEIKDQYWLETADGNANGGDFCVDCVEIQRRINKRDKKVKKADQFIHVRSDGGCAMAQDSQLTCERCGVLLACSPTRYAIEQDIAWLSGFEKMDDHGAAVIHYWMTGMGDYQRKIDWPLIEPHAIRLMKVAGVEVVDPGFVRFKPSELLILHHYDDCSDERWILAYEYYAKKLVEYRSKINESMGNKFNSIHDKKDFVAWLVGAFRDSEFLSSIGVNGWADLDKSILLPDHRPSWFPDIFDVVGRVLKQPGPNECHPLAIHVYKSALCFSMYDLKWSYVITYGYPHDSSSWTISLKQVDGQELPELFAAIHLYNEQVMEPEDRWQINARHTNNQEWGPKYKVLREVFYFSNVMSEVDDYEIEKTLTDRLLAIKTRGCATNRIQLDAKRLKVLEDWIKQDIEKFAKKASVL